MSAIHVADTGLFVAMGQPSNQPNRAIKRFAVRNEIAFVLPEQVYDELTVFHFSEDWLDGRSS